MLLDDLFYCAQSKITQQLNNFDVVVYKDDDGGDGLMIRAYIFIRDNLYEKRTRS